jgi:hypothetical protein
MDLTSGDVNVSAPDQQLLGSPLSFSSLSQLSDGGLGDANSTKDEKTLVAPLSDDIQGNDAVAPKYAADEDGWPTSYQQPKGRTQVGSAGTPVDPEEAESFLSRPFERLDQLELLTQFEQDVKEAVEFEKGAAPYPSIVTIQRAQLHHYLRASICQSSCCACQN